MSWTCRSTLLARCGWTPATATAPIWEAVEDAFGDDIDYAQLVKIYGEAPEAEKRYSPATMHPCQAAGRDGRTRSGPYLDLLRRALEPDHEMRNRRFTRLTNAFSKKFESHFHTVALYSVGYNRCASKRACGSCQPWPQA
jgi:hypothetical protein